MAITPEEQDAIKLLNIQKELVRANAFTMFREFRSATPEELEYSGHKTREAAILWAVENSLKQILRLEEDHLRRFPD